MLSSYKFINHFLKTSALDELTKRFDVTIVVPDNLVDCVPNSYSTSVKSVDFSVFKEKKEMYIFFQDIFTWRSRAKSISFKYRDARRNSWTNFIFEVTNFNTACVHKTGLMSRSTKEYESVTNLVIKGRTLICWSIRFSKFIVTKFLLRLKLKLRKTIIRTLSLDLISGFVDTIFDVIFSPPSILRNAFMRNEFECVVFASSANEPIIDYLIKLGKEHGSKSIMIVDNWDNLSSKTIMKNIPDYVGTWGRQSSLHAENIQGVPRNRVFEIGSARFDHYKDLREAITRGRRREFRYVLFAGTYVEFDEPRVLTLLNEHIKSQKDKYHDLRIIYRPHPDRARRNLAKVECLEYVYVDEYILASLNEDRVLETDPKLVGELIINSEFVIGGLTSLLIEASILGKNYLALSHHEKFNLTSPRMTRYSFTHVAGIESLPNLTFCNALQDIEAKFQKMFESEPLNQNDIDSQLNHFYCVKTSTKFAEKLNHIIMHSLSDGNG